MKTCIFDIKRFAIHDGPGIRVTVFLKGCPLSCMWCHNPEGIPRDISRFSNVEKLDGVQIKKDVEIGRWEDAGDLVAEIERDRIYMEETCGGVTFSGGEPLMQSDALLVLLDLCRKRELHTCVDTSGQATAGIMQEVCKWTDLLLFDLKSMDDARHKEFTGVSNKRILQNLVLALQSKTETIIRIPLIPGFNDRDEEILAMRDFLSGFPRLKQVDILPYHKFADHKYQKLQNMNLMRSFERPADSRINEVKQIFESAGFSVNKGG